MTRIVREALAFVVTGIVLAGPVRAVSPWVEAGLTERQAAAHLLDRFTFGATPGQTDAVVASGIEDWFQRQLGRREDPTALHHALAGLSSLPLTNEEIFRLYPPAGQVRRALMDEGRLDPGSDRETQREVVQAYYDESGERNERELREEIVANKVLRAIVSPNQIEEVMVDFWYNHFYVSATDSQCRRFIGTYERDAIRRHVFGRFRDMLGATAKHPAMLLYLDNTLSVAEPHARTTADFAIDDLRADPALHDRYAAMLDRLERQEARRKERNREKGRRTGLNENYARELLELHTLGVDGGYDQHDVEEVARALTGWVALPGGDRRELIRERMHEGLIPRLGYALEGDFFFDAGSHDAGDKEILGRSFRWGGGLEEGEAVLDLLAGHRSTARHVAQKLAVRFVRDEPPSSIVDRLELKFVTTGGDLKAMLRAIVQSPEFWSEETRRAKIKSPFELAISGIRGLGGEVEDPRRLVRWIGVMGQPLYEYPAPTGFPDRAEMWVNAGALLHRMNFGLSLAAGNVKGVVVDPTELTGGREPESADAALRVYAEKLLPERDLEETLRVLGPMLGDPDVASEIRTRSEALESGERESEMDDLAVIEPRERKATKRSHDGNQQAQVVGLILGSPEFQRR